MEELVFNNELRYLVEALKEINEDIKKSIDEIEVEIECYGYEEYEELSNDIYEQYKYLLTEYNENILNLIEETKEQIPAEFDDENKFLIGRIRREEILDLLDSSAENISEFNWDSIEVIEEVIDTIEEYISTDIRDKINQRKRDSRRNELGLTFREQKKQYTIESIQSLKQQGFRQIEVSRKLGLSRNIVCRYWRFVTLNGIWEDIDEIINKKIYKIEPMELEDALD
jgi:hypothetical protein